MQQAGQAQIIQGDALDALRTLPDESVQCVVTSPPYFGLRDYGTAEWDGGDEDCGHIASLQAKRGNSGGLSNDPRPRGEQSHTLSSAMLYRDECGKCGATRIDRQIGLEPTPAEYVAKMVAVFREVRRVLRKDGVCWLNIGDSYASGEIGRHDGYNPTGNSDKKFGPRQQRRLSTGLKPKDLCGMPWRLAFALQADGWYLRQDIIWHKPNPMPESVTDRCTKAHEYVFLLSKSERYFYDAAAIAEPNSEDVQRTIEKWKDDPRVAEARKKGNIGSAPDRADSEKTLRIRNGAFANPNGRNKRSVWTITTEPYPEAHFATFPTELPRICILAGSRIGDTILDPFAGSGTTLQVALELSRAAIGIELNAEYVALANRRLNSTTLGLPLEIAA